MSAADNKAIFLSYASQDAEAARRICDTLRAEGVEVWFDADGGLEHGDEWDAKIRRQIKECVLFIPIISANTQAREEGYFRLEWDLAAERARTIASGVPFILPVVIDDTREPDALVPDRFRTVQWTRLPGGVVTPEVKARYLKLWSHRTGLLKSKTRTDSSLPAESPMLASTPQTKARWPLIVGIGAAVVAAGMGVFVAMRPAPTAVAAPTVAKSPATPAAPAPSKRYASSRPEVAALLMRVQAMTDKTDVARAELETALSLLDQAAKLDSTDANVWAERALVECRYITENLDITPARKNAALQHAKQAASLDPKNPNARMADARTQLIVSASKDGRDAALAIIASLVAEDSDRVDAYLLLAADKRRKRQSDESAALLDQAARLPGAAGRTAVFAAILRLGDRDWTKANEGFDQALALERSATALLWKSYIATFWLGDIAVAKQAIAGIPAGMLTEDFPAAGKLYVELWARDWNNAIATMRAIPRDYLGSGALSGPTGYYIGYALNRAGRKNAAEVEWRSALEVVNKRLESDPQDRTLFVFKAMLLAALGDRVGGERILQTLRELYPSNWDSSWMGHMLAMTLLPTEEAIARLAKLSPAGSQAGMYGNLKLDPFLDHLRSHPKFVELLAKTEADPKLNPAAAPAAASQNAAAREPGTKPVATAPSLDLSTVASAKVDTKSVAVLPFVNQSADKDNEYFSDGIADDLLTTLQKIPGLKVAARTSAWSFKGKHVTLKEVGETLGMAHVVEGSVQKSGNKVKITARLSRAATNEEVWSKSFGPLELNDVFATQTEIATAIVAELRGRLTGETATSANAVIATQVQAASKGGTKNPEAHQLYLRGKFHASQFSAETFSRAVADLRQAVKRDENFAVAWATLANTLSSQAAWGLSERPLAEAFAEARAAAQRALKLEPNLAEAHAALAGIQVRWDFDWKGAASSARSALALAPADSAILSVAAQALWVTESWERAKELFDRALALDPLNAEARMGLAWVCMVVNRPRDAEGVIRRMLELNPRVQIGYFVLGCSLLIQGRVAEASSAVEQEEDAIYRNVGLALVRWAQQRNAEAEAATQAVIARSDVVAFQLAEIYAYRGDRDRAFQWLEQALVNRDAGLAGTRIDPFLDSLHADPRWPAFLRKVGLADEQLK